MAGHERQVASKATSFIYAAASFNSAEDQAGINAGSSVKTFVPLYDYTFTR